jgi:hypothetical protein
MRTLEGLDQRHEDIEAIPFAVFAFAPISDSSESAQE